MKRTICIFGCTTLLTGIIFAQKDDSTNLTYYTPSILLKHGQFEVKQFNNLYTQTSWYDETGKKSELNQRATYFTSFNEFLYGVSERFNMGINAMFRSVRNDKPASFPLEVFQFDQSINARTALTSLGPQIRWVPVKKWKHFSVQNRLFIPLAPDLQGEKNDRPWLDFNAYQLWTQLFYDKIFGEYYILFLESDFIFALNREFIISKSAFYTPFKAFVGSFISKKWVAYFFGEISPYWGSSEVIASYYSQAGAGIKHQLSKRIELETIVTFFPLGKSSGAGQTFNLGIRYLQ